MTIRLSAVSVVAVLLALPAIAAAQYSPYGTSEYGGGWASPSLDVSQSIIRDVINREMIDRQVLANSKGSAQAASNPEFRPKGHPAAAVAAGSLAFTASLQRRQRNFAQFIGGIRANNPGSADLLQQLLDRASFSSKLDATMRAKGLASNNMADAFASFWMSLWLGSRGQVVPVSAVQGQNAKAFALAMLQSNSALPKMDSAAKQAVADKWLIQAGLIDVLIAQAKDDPQLLGQIAQMARRGASEWGLDLDLMRLTPAGFVFGKR